MKVSLDKENRFVTSDGKLDQKQALIYSGLKASWCYKKGTATPESIRESSIDTLIRRGLETFLNDHGTPNEHFEVSIEVTRIPKLLCMILNDEHQYTTCERSFRYTKVLPSDSITDLEVELYNKWYDISLNIFKEKYRTFFLTEAKNDEKRALEIMQKMAQENARQFISVLATTSIAYTAPWYQFQKIATFLMDMIKNPITNLEKIVVPYAKDFINQLIDLKIILLTKDAIKIYPNIEEKIRDDRKWLYRNNKNIKLSLFASNNLFSGINKPNAFGAAINYNSYMSFSAFAEAQRHRTSDFELEELGEFRYFIPEFIKGTSYEAEYRKDMLKLNNSYPQGQMVKVNVTSSLKNIIEFMGKERACDKAQQEIENWYVNQFVPDIVNGLEKMNEYEKEYLILKKEYLNKCRCAYPTYHCPNPCGHPRTKRKF